MKERLAFFDVDGTLFEGNLGIEFVKSLVKKGVFDKVIGGGIFAWYEKYKGGEIEKSLAVDEMYKLYARGLKGKNITLVNSLAKETWLGVYDRLHSFTLDLIESVKESGLNVFLISGSPVEMINKLGDKLGINQGNIVSGELEVNGGVYTGNIISYPGSSEQKVQAVNEIIEVRKLEVDWQGSMTMGDNERDSGLMKKTGISIAFEPNPVLQEEAKIHGWVVANRDNVLDLVKESLANIS